MEETQEVSAPLSFKRGQEWNDYIKKDSINNYIRKQYRRYNQAEYCAKRDNQVKYSYTHGKEMLLSEVARGKD